MKKWVKINDFEVPNFTMYLNFCVGFSEDGSFLRVSLGNFPSRNIKIMIIKNFKTFSSNYLRELTQMKKTSFDKSEFV